MTKHNKKYKLNKIKKKLQDYDLIFFFQTTDLDLNNTLRVNQKKFKEGFKLQKTHTNSLKITIKNSILLKYYALIKGSFSLGFYANHNEKFKDNFKNLMSLNSNIIVTSLKLHRKVYSSPQLRNVTTLNYNKNMSLFNKTLKNLIKKPYHVLKS